jgi:hypothetical protein
MTGSPQASPDNLIETLLEGLSPQQAAAALAGLVNRASARLHTLSRAQATAHKEQPGWPAWAQLQNASRALVLQASTCRELAGRLPAEDAPPPAPGRMPEVSGEPPPPASPDRADRADR